MHSGNREGQTWHGAGGLPCIIRNQDFTGFGNVFAELAGDVDFGSSQTRISAPDHSAITDAEAQKDLISRLHVRVVLTARFLQIDR